MVRNSIVRISPHHVEKLTATPESMARKYAAVQSIGEACGFVAPRVLEVQSDRIVMERIPDLIPLRNVYMSGDSALLDASIRRAGEALAQLHANLPREHGIPWTAPPGFAPLLERYAGRPIDLEGLPQAVLHCDYGFSNVCILRSAPETIAIIDPCANMGSTFDDWALGPIHIDVGKMLACLEGQVPLGGMLRRPSVRRINRLQRLFLEGYGQPTVVDEDVAHAFAYAVSSAQFRRRYGAISFLHRLALYNRLRGNFPTERKKAPTCRGNAS